MTARMNAVDQINRERASRKVQPLTEDQVQCVQDAARLQEAADMLADLRDRCLVRLPAARRMTLAGPLSDEDEARDVALTRRTQFRVVVVDRMATDDSQSNGGDEFYVTGYAGPDASLALAEPGEWIAVWVNGEEHSPA